MFGSEVWYVVLVAAGMLLVAILVTWERKPGVKGVRAVKRVDVVTDVPETVLAVEELPTTPRKRVKRMGVLTIDTTDLQVCEKCRSVWLGELIRSGKCGKCGGRLLIIVAEGAPPQYVVLSDERLTRLCAKLWACEELSV